MKIPKRRLKKQNKNFIFGGFMSFIISSPTFPLFQPLLFFLISLPCSFLSSGLPQAFCHLSRVIPFSIDSGTFWSFFLLFYTPRLVHFSSFLTYSFPVLFLVFVYVSNSLSSVFLRKVFQPVVYIPMQNYSQKTSSRIHFNQYVKPRDLHSQTDTPVSIIPESGPGCFKWNY